MFVCFNGAFLKRNLQWKDFKTQKDSNSALRGNTLLLYLQELKDSVWNVL